PSRCAPSIRATGARRDVHCRGAPFPPASTPFVIRPSAPRRDLHSFPTRRSSDLVLAEAEPRRVRVVQFHHPLPHRDRQAELGLRSEEHTSELQSPCNLVCRLLLEKKKRVCEPRGSVVGARAA